MNLNYDVAILGGGLAGGTLALQLLKANPSIKIAIFDKRSYPLNVATCKVGESTVELGAYYLSKIVGLEDHLKNDQILKLGLRYFLENESHENVEDRLEVGGSIFSPTPSYQLDRGILENHIKDKIEKEGGTFYSNSRVGSVNLDGAGPHSLTFTSDGESRDINARWVVDASGRAGILSNKLTKKLPTGHSCSSVWWRVSERLKVDDWGFSEEWKKQHTESNARWFSTCHLAGKGYWVWLIPLSSGYTSVGIVADSRIHDFNNFHTLEKAFNWLKEHEPQCYRVSEKYKDKVEDFLVMKDYAYSRERVFSQNRWAFTGEAGVFPDPFYSPGTDLIAVSNTYLTDLIERDLRGESFAGRAEFYNEIYLKFFNSVLKLFKDQYQIFGNPLLMPIKVYWDWVFYWNFIGRIFFEGRLCDLSYMAKERKMIDRMTELGNIMQDVLREWNEVDRPKAGKGQVDLSKQGFLRDLNRGLSEKHSEEDFDSLFKQGAVILESLATELSLYRQKRTGLPVPEGIMSEHTFTVLRNFTNELEAAHYI